MGTVSSYLTHKLVARVIELLKIITEKGKN